MAKRQSVASNELLRRTYKYIARNTTLPMKVRHQAQLQLNQFPNKSRPEMVKERCTETGRGGGVLTHYGLSRVSVRCREMMGDWLSKRQSRASAAAANEARMCWPLLAVRCQPSRACLRMTFY